MQRQLDELLAIRASEWLELLPTASLEELRAFAAWLGQSKRHVQEFLEIAEVEFCLGGLDAARKHDIEALIARLVPNVVPFSRKRPATVPGASAPFRAWCSWKVAALAACSGAVAIAATTVALRPSSPTDLYATGVGEHRVVELADSTIVRLNADSQMTVHVDNSERRVELKRGEALFKVTHDPARPFQVRTHIGTIQVVGTRFNVRNRLNGDTRVSVLEGQVRVTSSAAELLLRANQEADIHADGKIEARVGADVSNAVAWVDHRLVFEGATISEMVAEFNRHNRSLRLRLEGLDNDTRSFDAVFGDNEPESLAQLLSRERDLTVGRQGKEIIIRRKAGP